MEIERADSILWLIQELSTALGSDFFTQPAELFAVEKVTTGDLPQGRKRTSFSDRRPRSSSYKKDIVPPRETKSALIMYVMPDDSEFDAPSYSVGL